MMQLETCIVCRTTDHPRNLGLWVLEREMKPVHLQCWLAEYDAGRLPSRVRRTA